MCFNKTNQPYRIHLKDLNRFAEEYSQTDQDWTNIEMTQYNQDQRALVDILPGISSMLMLSQSLHVSSLFFVCTHMTSRPGEGVLAQATRAYRLLRACLHRVKTFLSPRTFILRHHYLADHVRSSADSKPTQLTTASTRFTICSRR